MCFPRHLTTALTLKQNADVLLFALGGEILTGTCSEPGSGPFHPATQEGCTTLPLPLCAQTAPLGSLFSDKAAPIS